MIDLRLKGNGKRVSPELYGIFLEDINYTCDGGLNANLVNNYSFDGVYLDAKKKGPQEDPLRYWQMTGVILESGAEKPLSQNSRYARLTANGKARLENLGYNGGGEKKNQCAMYIAPGRSYRFRCFLRNKSFSGKVQVYIADGSGKPLTDIGTLAPKNGGWQQEEISLTGAVEGYGKLILEFEGKGAFDIDCVEFFDADYWNAQDPKWRHGRLRRDLMETLKELHPAFIRFPGGCIVEGRRQGNEYNWKDTIGPLWERKAKYCLWAERVADGGYCQSYQIGFYEYFCMCEDLGAKPLPTLFAGLNCQMRCRSKIKTKDPAFESYVIQNYLDLIEFATGDPDESKWAKIRAEMGHPKPFVLDRIGVGNENMGKDYMGKFQIISKAITDKYPNIRCVMCAGVLPFDFAIKPFWKFSKTADFPFMIDEHSYHKPEWFFEASKKFDNYPRGSAKVYFGEYAANGLMAGKMTDDANANRFMTALSEAAFLTGVERNCDVVEMTSYAPLFNLAEAAHWPHNLIVFNPKTVMKTANYFVQQMFASHVGRAGMDVVGTLPEKFYASATEDDQAVYLKLVNGSGQAASVRIALDAPDGTAEAVCFQSADTQMKNNLAYNGEPRYRVQPRQDSLTVAEGTLTVQTEASGVYVITVRKRS